MSLAACCGCEGFHLDTQKLLVIEDSKAMQRVMHRLFKAESFLVEIATDGITGLQAFQNEKFNAVVLDLTLPGLPGRELCRQFKSLAPVTPVIVVSANCEVDEKVLLLELGADDYLTKPFSPKELLARVRRALRRVSSTAAAGSVPATTYRFSCVCVDVEAMEAVRNGQRVTLSSQEFRLLKYLLERPGRVVSRDELLNQVWGYQNYPSTRTVDNHILRLRQKLEPNPGKPQHFLTLIGAGYKFVATCPQLAR